MPQNSKNDGSRKERETFAGMKEVKKNVALEGKELRRPIKRNSSDPRPQRGEKTEAEALP